MAQAHAVRLDDVEIPLDAKANASWPPIMLDLAAHIGPHATLLIVDAFAGQEVYVPVNGRANPFTAIIGAEKAAVVSHVYGLERLRIPGRRTVVQAKRAAVLAAVRNRKMTLAAGAALIGMARRHFSRLINKTDEGTEAAPFVIPERPKDARQLEMFGEEAA